MRKLLFIFMILLVIFSTNVYARRDGNFSTQDAYDWLLQQGNEGNFNNNILDTSLSVLALRKAGSTGIKELDYIRTQQNEAQKCWPLTSCQVKDTSFALLTFMEMAEDELKADAIEWLEKAQTPALTNGNWWLQIDTSDTGTCKISYTRGTTDVTKDVDIDQGVFTSCGGSTFFDLENCLESGLLNNFASLKLHVDCSSLTDAIISIVYNSGNSYYLYDEIHNKKADLVVKNGCFGTGYRSGCDFESTAYAEWVLNKVNSDISSELYLREEYSESSAMHNALMLLATEDPIYAEQLKSLQKSDGSWDTNTFTTSLVILSMTESNQFGTEVEEAVEWLKERQFDDGSWEKDVTATAMTLFAVFNEDVSLPSCNDGNKNQGERGLDCGGPCQAVDNCCSNGIKDLEEEGIDCGGSYCEDCLESICDNDGECDLTQGEDCSNCPNDCLTCVDLCGDGYVSEAAMEEGIDCGGLCDVSCGEVICNYNELCEINLVDEYGLSDNEDSQNCPSDCLCGDTICDEYERETASCESDCGAAGGTVSCGDGFCDPGEEDSCPDDCSTTVFICDNDGSCDRSIGEDCDCGDCTNDPDCDFSEEGGGSIWWVILIFLLLIGGGVGYYLYQTSKKSTKTKGHDPFAKYGLGKKPNYSSFAKPHGSVPQKPKGMFSSKPAAQTSQRRAGPIFGKKKPIAKSKLDSEIEKSIGEAKKLLGKEK